MNLRNREDTGNIGIGRRGLLKVSCGLLATVGTTGCLNADGSEAEIEYRNWVPASFDPMVMYVDVNVLGEHHSLWESGEGDSQYGLTFDDISEIVGTSGAEILVLNEDATPDIADDEGTAWDDYGGYTIHKRDSEVGGFVANSGDAVIEAQTQDAIESVIDARAGDATRLHEEDEVFEALTTKVGEGDLVVVPQVNGRQIRRREARAADVSEVTSDITIAIEAEEDEFPDTADELREREYMTIDEIAERDTEAGVLVLRGTVETESIPEAFGLVGEASSSSESVGESSGESDSMNESEAESGSVSESESESQDS